MDFLTLASFSSASVLTWACHQPSSPYADRPAAPEPSLFYQFLD